MLTLQQVSDRLELLELMVEARLRRLEDELAIQRLICSYGPAVDSGDSQTAAALWRADGTYDVGGRGVAAGTEAIAALFDGEQHQELIHGGAGHVLNPPYVSIEGNRATAIGYSVVFKWIAGAFVVFRVSANKWELERGSAGWNVVHRINRLLDGAEEARLLLGTLNPPSSATNGPPVPEDLPTQTV